MNKMIKKIVILFFCILLFFAAVLQIKEMRKTRVIGGLYSHVGRDIIQLIEKDDSDYGLKQLGMKVIFYEYILLYYERNYIKEKYEWCGIKGAMTTGGYTGSVHMINDLNKEQLKICLDRFQTTAEKYKKQTKKDADYLFPYYCVKNKKGWIRKRFKIIEEVKREIEEEIEEMKKENETNN